MLPPQPLHGIPALAAQLRRTNVVQGRETAHCTEQTARRCRSGVRPSPGHGARRNSWPGAAPPERLQDPGRLSGGVLCYAERHQPRSTFVLPSACWVGPVDRQACWHPLSQPHRTCQGGRCRALATTRTWQAELSHTRGVRKGGPDLHAARNAEPAMLRTAAQGKADGTSQTPRRQRQTLKRHTLPVSVRQPLSGAGVEGPDHPHSRRTTAVLVCRCAPQLLVVCSTVEPRPRMRVGCWKGDRRQASAFVGFGSRISLETAPTFPGATEWCWWCW